MLIATLLKRLASDIVGGSRDEHSYMKIIYGEKGGSMQIHDKIRLHLKQNKLGVLISVASYKEATNFIIRSLHSTETKRKTLVTLLDEASAEQHRHLPRTTVTWYLLQVKQDLEARRLLKTSINHDKTQEVELARNYRKLLKQLPVTIDPESYAG